MEEKQKNYFYNILNKISICILPLLVTPYLSRVLGATNNGIYAYTYTIASYFVLFCKLGVENYGNRAIASCVNGKEERDRVFCEIYVMQMISSLVSVCLYLLLTFTLFSESKTVYLIQGLFVVSAVFDTSWYLYGTGDFKYPAIRSIIMRFAILGGILVFVKSESDLIPYTMVMSLCFLSEQLMLIPKMIKLVKPQRVKWKNVVNHFGPNLKLFIPLMALSIFNWMDKVMIGALTDAGEVAFYNYADSIINLPKGVIAAIGMVMLPRISAMVAKDDLGGYKKELQSSTKLIFFICSALCFGIAGMAPNFVPFFLGPGYEKTISLTVWLAGILILMSYIDIMQSLYLIPFKKDNAFVMSVLAGTVVNFALNFIFIPKYLGFGAVIGTFGTEIVIFLIQLFIVREVYTIWDCAKSIAPFIPGGILEFVIVRLIANTSSPALLVVVEQVIAGGIIYLICCALLCSKDVKTLLKKNKGD